MLISEVARSAGVGVETIRFYENKGLIARPLQPSDGGYRMYSTETLHRIRFIKCAQQLGFSLEEINELLKLESGPDTQCREIRDCAEAKLQDVTVRIDNLTHIKAALETLIEACPGKGPARKCSILGEIRRGGLSL